MILFNNCSSSKGQKYAMMELKVIVASILLNFNIESTQKSEDLRHNPVWRLHWVLYGSELSG